MMAISAAIRRAPPESDPFIAAYVGTLRDQDYYAFKAFRAAASRESFADWMVAKLHETFPDLGRSVRSWPRVAEAAEQHDVIQPIKRYSDEYRRGVHCSLWQFIQDLGNAGTTNSYIADVLAKAGL